MEHTRTTRQVSRGTRLGPPPIVALLGVLLTLTLAGCGFARLFFDLPEPESAGNDRVPSRQAFAEPGGSLLDTVPPPIEATLLPDSVLALLPKDSGGFIDWVGALRGGVVRPRRALPGEAVPPDMRGFAFDFRYQGPMEMFDATFPHSSHVEWMTCQTCHPAIFPYRGDTVTMTDVNNGEACGVCHGPVAFPVAACFRCHQQMPPSGQVAADLGPPTALARAADATATGGFPHATFPHWVHRIRYRCSACHPSLFATRAGADTLTMARIRGGEGCGRCHNGNAAFGVLDCNRCHVPEERREAP